MKRTREQHLSAARRALQAVEAGRGCDCTVVEMQIDGTRFVVDFDLDAHEHLSRRARGIGPVTNTGLLHALWELPAGLPVPVNCLRGQDAATLREIGGGYVQGTDVLTRTFNPAGRIRSVVVVSNGMENAMARVSKLPPIFRRIAVAFQRPSRIENALHWRALIGVGSVLVGNGGAEVLTEPGPPTLGVPAVYRWWLAELAYRNWGYVNCAHCVI